MSLPQHIVKDQGGSISVEVLTRPTAGTVSVFGPDGTTLVDEQAVTVTSIATTTDEVANAGDDVLSLTAVTNITEGKKLWLRAPVEQVTVKSVDATAKDVTLWEPLLHDHADGETVQSCLVTYTVSSSDASKLFFDGRARWTLDSVITEFTGVECTEYPLPRRATMTDVRRWHAKIADELDSEDDPERLLDTAHEDVLVDIGARNRARCFTGSAEFSRAVAARFLMNHYTGKVGVAMELYEQWKETYTQELSKVTQTTPRDGDQDGVIEENEVMRGMRNVPLSRS
jgi:hypothetical protein